MFIDNKYRRAYNNIIYKAKNQNREKDKDVYYELHHIIPRSLSYEMRNDKNNLVFLTAKEHFICHLLLPKFVMSKNHIIKMNWALHRMVFNNSNRMIRKYTSAQYELVRKIHSKNMSGDLHPSKNSISWLPNLKKSIQESWDNNPERKITTSKTMRKTWGDNYNDMKQKAIANFHKGSLKSAELRRGRKFPEWGQYGRSNPAANHWVITTPNNEIINLYGTISQYAKDIGLSADMLKRNGQTPKGYKGYYVKNNGKINNLKEKEASENG